ncbi:MAG: response regulator, partial [Actinobacteria bacterium]|nr:response regulator [Actinomycetota bacterium]
MGVTAIITSELDHSDRFKPHRDLPWRGNSRAWRVRPVGLTAPPRGRDVTLCSSEEGVDQQERRVLVVDDQAEVRRLVKLVLTRRGYAVTEAANGRIALQRLRDEPFDLVVTDVQMPEVDGITLLEQCVALYPHVDVIVLTAYGSIQNAVDAM